MMKTELDKLCIVGQSTDSGCIYPATESLPHRFGRQGEPHMCAYHAALDPLWDDVNEMNLSLVLVRAYLKGARHHPGAGPLVTALERIEADFAERVGVVHKVLDDLREAERKLLMR